MTQTNDSLRLSLRIHFDGQDRLGPGKADILERIAASGSIAAAARDMGMSYKRAWDLIETLNAMFDTPLVISARGGPGTGAATLTDRGRAVLQAYREVEAAARAGAQEPLARLRAWLGPTSGGPNGD